MQPHVAMIAAALALGAGSRAEAQDYMLEGATFYSDLCAYLPEKTFMDWPGGATDNTNNGSQAGPDMVMDRAVQYHWRGAPTSLIQWQDPVWVPEIRRFRMGVAVAGSGNILFGVVDPNNRNAVRGAVRVIPSMGMMGAEEVILADPQGPFPAPPETYGFLVMAGDGGACQSRAMAEYWFRLVD